MQAMYDLVGDRIQEIFDAQVVDIGILDPETGIDPLPVHDRAGGPVPRRADRGRSGFRRGSRSRRASRSWSTRTSRDCSAAAGQPLVLSGEAPKSVGVRAPRRRGARRPASISLQNLDREHAFSDADVRLLTTLAGSLSVALENARLFEETRQRNAELALINDVQRGLAENLEMQAMYDLVGDRLQEIFDAQIVDIGILDPDGHAVHFPYTIERGVRFPDEPMEVIGFRKHVLETREPARDQRATSRSASAEFGHRSCTRGRAVASRSLFVPLVVGDRRRPA